MFSTQLLQLHGTYGKGKVHRRPKLLFLAYFFPPARTIACVRTWNFAKYLTRLGWDVTVVTPHPYLWRDVENLVETDATIKREGINRIVTDHRWRCLAAAHLNCWNHGIGWFAGGICRRIAVYLGVDSSVGWIEAAEHACSNLNANDVDVIFATGSPLATFKLAKHLSARFNCPYVLDYRDIWIRSVHTSRLARLVTTWEEAKLLAGCTAVTIISASLGLALDGQFDLGRKLHVVTNGFDPEEVTDVEPYDFGHFAIVYTGSFYQPQRVISPVMAALKRLKENTNDQKGRWYFHYYGGQEDHVREEAKRFDVIERVVLHGNVPRAEALSAVRGAGVAVVITSVLEESTMENRGIITGKVFEAIGLRTPVLLVAPSDSDARALAESTGLARSFTGNDIGGMASFLRSMIFGNQHFTPKNLEAYAWPNIAKRLDSILRVTAGVESRREQFSR